MIFLKYTAYILTLIGALNWGLVGIFGLDLVATVLGDMSILSRIVYSLVGVSAIITALTVHNCERIENKKCNEYGNCNF